ncbi:MAG TPA: Hsp20/alpha crystallin family protein [Streptosporangiaceae bacterium]
MAMLPATRMRRTLTPADPSREFEDIYERMGQLVNAAFGDAGLAAVADMSWVPPADLTETDDAYIVHVELPGAHKDQLHVQIADRELLITGEIRDAAEGRRHHSSRRTGKFEFRTIFPGDIKAPDVSAELADGVLTVRVPKLEQAKPNQVKVTGPEQAAT